MHINLYYMRLPAVLCAGVLFVWYTRVETNAWLPPYCITCVIFTVYMCIGCVRMSVTADIKRHTLLEI